VVSTGVSGGGVCFAPELRNSSAKDSPVLGWSNGVVAEGVRSAVGVVGVGGG
jgi:hypothetical protein